MVKKRKKRLRITILLLFLILLGVTIYMFTSGFNFVFNGKIKNIYISGNNIVKDKDIIELAKIEDYPRILSISSGSMKKKIMTNPYIKTVDIDKKWGNIIYINVVEYKALFYDEINKNIILDNKKTIQENSDVLDIPILNNTIADIKIYDKLIEKFVLVNDNIKSKISEIIYSPTNVDKERFIFYMNDSNEVYITLTKIENVNEYLSMLKVFENKKGRIYLDAGKYFEEY